MHDGEKASRLGLPGIPAEAEAAHIVRDARWPSERGSTTTFAT